MNLNREILNFGCGTCTFHMEKFNIPTAFIIKLKCTQSSTDIRGKMEFDCSVKFQLLLSFVSLYKVEAC